MPARFALVQQAASAGNVDFVAAGEFGGDEPLGALFWATNTLADKTATVGSAQGYGIADGVSRWAMSCSRAHGVALPNPTVARVGMTDQCFVILNPATGAIECEADFVTFLPDGVRINFGVAASAIRVNCLLIDCDNFAAATADIANPGGDSVNVGFRGSLALVFSNGIALNDVIDNNLALMSIGAVSNQDPTFDQVCQAYVSDDSDVDGAVQPRIVTIPNLAALQEEAVAGFTATDVAFTYLDLGGGNDIPVAFCVLDVGANTCFAEEQIVSSGAGLKTFLAGGAPFERTPQLVGQISGFATGFGFGAFADDDRAQGLGFALTSGEMSAYIGEETGADPSNARSISASDQVLNSIDPDGVAAYVATLDSFVDGPSAAILDYATNTQAANRLMPMFFVESDEPPAGRPGNQRRPHFNSGRWHRDRWRFD